MISGGVKGAVLPPLPASPRKRGEGKPFVCHCERNEAINDLEIASSPLAPRNDCFSASFSTLLAFFNRVYVHVVVF